MALSTLNGIYADELISAKELNRQSGRVLEMALERPVTITRNNQYFALLPREQVASLVQAANCARLVFEVTNVAFRLMRGEEIGTEHPYGWLSSFDSPDLNDFIDEVTTTFRLVDGSRNSLDEVGAVIHEWHESAIANLSPDLAEAFNTETDEVPLSACAENAAESH